MEFFSIENLTSPLVNTGLDPRAFTRPPFGSKEKFKAWCAHRDTRHCFYSLYEGLAPKQRISKENPPMLMHGVVADYDCDMDDTERRDRALNKCPAMFRPNWVCRTFSGGVRAIWRFERPIPVHNAAFCKALSRIIRKQLKLARFFPGLDEGAMEDSSQYFEAGTKWDEITTDLIPADFTMKWLVEAGNRHDWDRYETAIPMDQVAAEVERQFPGRWSGPFEVGARGVRFWDPQADNQSAAIVRSAGMQCFTGSSAFVPWKAILGTRFVAQYEAKKIGGAITDVYFDGKDYWHQLPDGRWTASNKADISLRLRVESGLSAEVPRDETASELDRALFAIQQNNTVECVAPQVFQPRGLNRIGAARVVNCSNLECCQPSEDRAAGPESFPWIHGFLQGFFDPPEALDNFLAWLQRWYRSALERAMLPGQTLYIAGPPNRGKTLLSNVILSQMFGGHADASSFLTGEETFNSQLFEVALWTLDDALPCTDSRRHSHYSGIIKKMVANRVFSFREKYRTTRTVNWNGRVVVTLNTDPESLHILPDLDISLQDKLCLFKVADTERNFPPDLINVIRGELPSFCRWLLNWSAPDEVVGDTRYGARSYWHEELVEHARAVSGSYSFGELLQMFMKDKDAPWVGTASELFQQMSLPDSGLDMLVKEYTPFRAGKMLGKLKSQGKPIKNRILHGVCIWTIEKVENVPF
ncbi:MAG: hypothetical protein KA248_14265 [Kiritimatiellae bacterium]|nr:hypothetical protein [Kiritimatiellia bacterium]